MLSILAKILCILENLALTFLAILIMAFNAIVAGVGGLLAVAAALLPNMPDPPEWTSGASTWTESVGWANWLFPITTLLTAFTSVVALYVIWIIASAFLRWGKQV
jgi:hypothetical protein